MKRAKPAPISAAQARAELDAWALGVASVEIEDFDPVKSLVAGRGDTAAIDEGDARNDHAVWAGRRA